MTFPEDVPGPVVSCDQCGGAAYICEQPDSTCRLKTLAREWLMVGHQSAVDAATKKLAPLLRKVEDGAWGRLSRARTLENEMLTARVKELETLLRMGGIDYSFLGPSAGCKRCGSTTADLAQPIGECADVYACMRRQHPGALMPGDRVTYRGREQTVCSVPRGSPQDGGPSLPSAGDSKFAEVLEQTKDWTLVDALSHVAIRENDRAVKQALRGERDSNTGALWDTCFRYIFRAVLDGRSEGANYNDGLRDAAQLIFDMSEFYQHKADGLRALDDVRQAILERAGRDPNEQGAAQTLSQRDRKRREK